MRQERFSERCRDFAKKAIWATLRVINEALQGEGLREGKAGKRAS